MLRLRPSAQRLAHRTYLAHATSIFLALDVLLVLFDSLPVPGLDARCKVLPRLHVGIMTSYWGPDYLLPYIDQNWGREFAQSPYFGGINYACEVPLVLKGAPLVTAIPNISEFPITEKVVNRMFAKRLTSIHYFLTNTTAPFMVFITDDTLIYVRNLHYLFEWMEERGLTRDSHFILANCLGSRDWEYLHGGGGWLMSRYTANVIWENRQEAYGAMKAAEDWDFSAVCPKLAISVRTSASEFFLGHYIPYEDRLLMENRRFHEFRSCPTERALSMRPRDTDCRLFLAPWNRVVFVHRVSQQDWPPDELAPVYDCPDELHWWMGSRWPVFCMKRANWTSEAGIG
jgi:hypothetical protein